MLAYRGAPQVLCPERVMVKARSREAAAGAMRTRIEATRSVRTLSSADASRAAAYGWQRADRSEHV
eukprot:scaffold4120_cov400-Prasinococcus_capsulatus_cf.AAC.3